MNSLDLNLNFQDDGLFRYYLETGLGFNVWPIDIDGNCLYASLAFYLYGNEEFWPEVRRVVATEVFLHPGRYEEYWEGDSLIDLVEHNLTPGEWGGDLELHAAARFYKVNIVVYQANGYYPTFPHDAPHQMTIALSYHSEGHYNALLPAWNF